MIAGVTPNTLPSACLLYTSRDEFLRLDEEIKRARDNMQLWQEKEAALMPANFSPDSPFGTYGQDIEDLIQQGAKWEQLRRECEEGDAYIRKAVSYTHLS